jgi:UDP-N-acetylglucosamine diphosphorylase / glucose-1-phosphate thymidylyltransferase / UDP-N-acetylgalactosamine diphosphorylase / glucosamine-1-phosphate N-acetyltransferase / galactosamine-1-phosphate N-acetyltransferase
MKIILFEDEKYQDLLPLVYFRPVWELRCGIFTLEEKIHRSFPENTFNYLSRKYLQEYYLSEKENLVPEKNEEYLFINGRVLFKQEYRKILDELPPGNLIMSSDVVAAFKINGDALEELKIDGLPDLNQMAGKFKVLNAEINLISYPWDLIDKNGAEIENDFKLLNRKNDSKRLTDKTVHLLNREYIHIGQNTRIMPGVVLDAENGPIWIDDQVKIMANAVLEGPVAIGKSSTVKIGAKIYENTSIGPVCKVGGEVEETIIQEYSNKQHDGFLGHSYLGAWINIGADTNNSDLKNNYGEISVYLNNHTVETGHRFLGLIMGDHSKTAINTMFNTGTVVGVSSNIFGSGFPPKYIPSFSWGGSGGLREYNFDKAIEVAEIVMKRRNVPFTARTKNLFREVNKLTLEVENRVRMQ